MEASAWAPTRATAPPAGKACCVRSVSVPLTTEQTPSEGNEDGDEPLSRLCILSSQHNVSRNVFTAAGVFDPTSAPAGAGARVRSAPGG